LCSASCVIFAHNLMGQKRLKAVINELGIPAYYFTDVDFVALYQAGHPDYSAYSPQAVQATAKQFAGLLLATPHLIQQCQRLGIEKTFSLLDPNCPSPTTAWKNLCQYTMAQLLERHPTFGLQTLQERVMRLLRSKFITVQSLTSVANWLIENETEYPTH
jgi:hypothetical protein